MIINLYAIIIMAFTHQDTECMALALKLSQFGRKAVGANPMVGCVISRDDKIIAQDYHRLYGEGHAEVNALEKINYKGEYTNVYITLEPCTHFGKTPPCADALIRAGVKKVFIAMLDPNPLVSGSGVRALQDNGIEVEVGLLEVEANEINRGFVKRMTSGLPFVTSKIAMSLDGRTAMKNGESKWITSKASREDVQMLRSLNQAILTGSGTIKSDNPMMTVRTESADSNPLRVVIDSNNIITDKSLNIFSSDAETLILNNNNSEMLANGKLDLKSALIKLGEMGINNLLLEAGSGLNGAMTEAGLIDEFIIYTAPLILGSDANPMIEIPLKKMSDKIKLNIIEVSQIDCDIKIRATIK
ncbi:bifunctional diaminohydroxyphosphoribosylaminopyrimidine deaminase/5-amino-6-(5-phosphoribosylamino)uracil reductase RibD [Candidatus Thioglobus sp.]|jgi:diaminohydroxyphosphoribosylaminopyrimidine deaminase/5-amino-6-(5-phosphoribosylamino)uracil reductase|nr:bifunctional diaminohydroxyphosphoribosylaminopyrimidine deaminase/5-amino-6-(5-phosphoribosylamino)uracil reductase RibD [Candidatus Thioglobus sp.]